jgi:hypothetical protein
VILCHRTIDQYAVASPAAIFRPISGQEAAEQFAIASAAAIIRSISGQDAQGQYAFPSAAATALIICITTGGIVCQDAVVHHTFIGTTANFRGVQFPKVGSYYAA